MHKPSGPAALLLALPLLAATFDSASWKYSRAIEVQQPDRVQVVPIDNAVYSHARPDLADLRITRNGEETAYVLETLREKIERREIRGSILNKAVVPNSGLRFSLDSAKAGRHSRITFTTPEKNFRQRVRIETSEDGQFWVKARENGYIFDFSQGDTHAAVLTVDYPVSTARYVRATVFGWSNTSSVQDAGLEYWERIPATRDIIATPTPERTEDVKTRASLLILDLAGHVPHDQVRLESEGAAFHRAVEIESSDDRKDWRVVSRGVIFQVADERSLTLQFPERTERYLRLRIFNGDDRPVPVTRVIVETLRRQIRIPAFPLGGGYVLYFGNSGARAPQYDLAAVMARQQPLPEITPSVREWQSNPAYVPPAEEQKPWTERYPGVFYTVLGTAVAGMLVLTLQFLNKIRRQSPEP